MKKITNEQSLLLRRRLTIQTLITLAIFTAVFAIFAIIANNMLVPTISEAVVDTTAERVRFDPIDYASRYDVGKLVEAYRETQEQDGNSVEVVWIDPAINGATDKAIFGVSVSDPESSEEATTFNLSQSSEQSDALSESESPEQESGMSIAASVVEDKSTKAAEASEQQETDPYDVVIGKVKVYPNDELKESNPTGYIEDLTLRKLGYYAAWQAYLELKGDWDFWYEGNSVSDKYSTFVARNLTLYDRIKTLKLPVTIALYMLGCLLIVIFQMRKSLRYFDELSSAVAGVITDRSKPVELSPHLSVAQNELNRIRAESLADEYAAQAAEQRKNELVAYLAHDIRTPLTSILGYLSLLDESPDLPTDSRKRFTRTALEKAERLEDLIDEFFEITRYNLQTIPIERSNVDIRLFFEQIADEFMPVANEKSVQIEIETEATDSESFFVDGGKLARAVENVLRNAVSFADSETAVQILVAPCKDNSQEDTDETADSSSAKWKISITNKGREISPEHLESIFEKFYREDNARNSSTGGAGLGLAIAKEIITAHGGSISATSQNGQTTFNIVV